MVRYVLNTQQDEMVEVRTKITQLERKNAGIRDAISGIRSDTFTHKRLLDKYRQQYEGQAASIQKLRQSFIRANLE